MVPSLTPIFDLKVDSNADLLFYTAGNALFFSRLDAVQETELYRHSSSSLLTSLDLDPERKLIFVGARVCAGCSSGEILHVSYTGALQRSTPTLGPVFGIAVDSVNQQIFANLGAASLTIQPRCTIPPPVEECFCTVSVSVVGCESVSA